MAELTADAFRTVGRGDAIPAAFGVPCYLDDLNRRISVARVDGRLHAVDDLSTGAVIDGPATAPLNVYEVRELDGDIQIRA